MQDEDADADADVTGLLSRWGPVILSREFRLIGLFP